MPSPEALGLVAYYCHGVKDAAEAAMQMKANESSGTCTQECGLSMWTPAYKTTGHTGECLVLNWFATMTGMHCCTIIPPQGRHTCSLPFGAAVFM